MVGGNRDLMGVGANMATRDHYAHISELAVCTASRLLCRPELHASLNLKRSRGGVRAPCRERLISGPLTRTITQRVLGADSRPIDQAGL